MRLTIALFGVEVVEVEVDRGGHPDDVDLSDYELGSETERADVEAWREDVDEDAPHRPRIIAAGAHRPRRRRAPVIAIGSKHRGKDLHSSVDANRNTRAAAGFGFTPRGAVRRDF